MPNCSGHWHRKPNHTVCAIAPVVCPPPLMTRCATSGHARDSARIDASYPTHAPPGRQLQLCTIPSATRTIASTLPAPTVKRQRLPLRSKLRRQPHPPSWPSGWRTRHLCYPPRRAVSTMPPPPRRPPRCSAGWRRTPNGHETAFSTPPSHSVRTSSRPTCARCGH